MPGFKFKDDTERWACINALNLAAATYRNDAAKFSQPHEASLRQQFNDQADIADRLAVAIEEEG